MQIYFKTICLGYKSVYADTLGRLFRPFQLVSHDIDQIITAMANEQPTYGNGKICYLEIPALDINASADFYNNCFSWKIRNDNGGHVSFDDGVGEVSGMWVLGKQPIPEGSIIISIMVNDAELTMKKITENGGKIIFSDKMKSGEVIVHFIDPAGNVMGIYQSA